MRKALFLIVGFLVGACSLPYSVATTLISGNGELVTMVCRKMVSPPDGLQ